MAKKVKEQTVANFDELVKKLNLTAGKKIAFLGEDDSIEKVEVIPTGILPLDFALGIGGIPLGRITNIYGLQSVGKSTICYTIIARAQEMGIECAIVDAEYSYQPEYAEKFGVNTEKLLVIQPDCLEEGFEAIEAVIRGGYGLILVDSISSMVPRALAEAEHGKSPMAMQARGISQGLIKLISPLSKNKCALVAISQLRINIMAMHPGDKYTVTGGFALKFYSSIIIEMKRLKAIMAKGDAHVGYQVGFTIKKNKLARPGGECEVPYMLDEGFSKDGDLVQMAVDRGIIEQKGAWFVLKGEQYQGKEKTSAAIDADPSLKAEIIGLLFPLENQP